MTRLERARREVAEVAVGVARAAAGDGEPELRLLWISMRCVEVSRPVRPCELLRYARPGAVLRALAAGAVVLDDRGHPRTGPPPGGPVALHCAPKLEATPAQDPGWRIWQAILDALPGLDDGQPDMRSRLRGRLRRVAEAVPAGEEAEYVRVVRAWFAEFRAEECGVVQLTCSAALTRWAEHRRGARHAGFRYADASAELAARLGVDPALAEWAERRARRLQSPDEADGPHAELVRRAWEEIHGQR